MDVIAGNSSLILAVVVGIWLIWVVPFALRRRHRPIVAQLAPAAIGEAQGRSSSAQAGRVSTTKQGLRMLSLRDGDQQAPAAGSGAAPEEVATADTASRFVPASLAGLNIRWDRMALAGVGVFALLIALVAGVLAAMSLVPVFIPLVALFVVVAAVAGLRGLAIWERRAAVDAAINEAIDANDDVAPAPRPQAPARPVEVFDAAAGEEAPHTLSADELRAAALSLTDAQPAVASTPGSWQPVEVPRPMYADAPKADRVPPAPVVAPSVAPSSKVSIRASEAGRRPAAAPAPSQEAPARLQNLDDVLARRRGA